MLKVHFIKNFSIKKCVLDKSLLDPLEFQSHLPEAWSASLQPGTAGSAGPGGGSPGRAGPGSSKLQVTVVAVGACAPTSVFPQQSWLLSGSVGAEAPLRVWFGVHNPGDAGMGLGIWVCVGRLHC